MAGVIVIVRKFCVRVYTIINLAAASTGNNELLSYFCSRELPVGSCSCSITRPSAASLTLLSSESLLLSFLVSLSWLSSSSFVVGLGCNSECGLFLLLFSFFLVLSTEVCTVVSTGNPLLSSFVCLFPDVL